MTSVGYVQIEWRWTPDASIPFPGSRRGHSGGVSPFSFLSYSLEIGRSGPPIPLWRSGDRVHLPN